MVSTRDNDLEWSFGSSGNKYEIGQKPPIIFFALVYSVDNELYVVTNAVVVIVPESPLEGAFLVTEY